MTPPPFCAIKLYYAADVPDMRAHFDARAQGNVIIRILGDEDMWVWSALYHAIGILYSVSAKVVISDKEVLLLANEY